MIPVLQHSGRQPAVMREKRICAQPVEPSVFSSTSLSFRSFLVFVFLVFPLFFSIVNLTSSLAKVPLFSNLVNGVPCFTWMPATFFLKLSVSLASSSSDTLTVLWLFLNLYLLVPMLLRSPLCASSANTGECRTKILLLFLNLRLFSFLLWFSFGVGVLWLAFCRFGCLAFGCCSHSRFLNLLTFLLQRMTRCWGEGSRGAAGGTTAYASANSPQRPHLPSTAQHQVVRYWPQANWTWPSSNQLLANGLTSTATDAPSIASNGTPASALTAGLSHASKTS